MLGQGVITPQAFRRTLARLILLPVALLGVLALIFLLQLNGLVNTSRLVTHTNRVIDETRLIEEALLDQQISLRGYLIGGDAGQLVAYRASGETIERELVALGALVADNPAQIARRNELERRYRDWVGYADALVGSGVGSGAAGLAESERRVRATRAVIDTFTGTEQELLAERSQQIERSTRLIVVTSVASIVIIGGLLAWAVWRQVRGLSGQYGLALERARAQAAALRESEGRFRDLANALPQVVWTTHPDGSVAFLNQRWCDYTGLTSERVAGRDWLGPIHPDDRPAAAARWDAALASGEPFDAEYRFRHADGDYRWQLARALPVRDGDARVVYWVCSGTDIDDHKRSEVALRERTQRLAQATRALADRNRELDQFAYVTSHDLKAPLRGIANLAQWIEEDLGDLANDEIRQQLDLLRGRVQRMEALIEGILQFSRIGRVKETIESVDVGELLAEIVDLLAPPPGFTVEIGPGMPTIVTERTRLQQVFGNLLSNALKHHDRAEGRIAVAVRPADEPGYDEFTVADDGPGIALQFHERIFGIFQTLRPRDQVEGSGLGLALVKKIVERHGGRIWLESAEGQGTTFHFTWPREVASADVGEAGER